MAEEWVAGLAIAIDPRELDTRLHRWRFFQATFFFTYVGILLDVVTTSMGFQHIGPAYEQNPIGAALISTLGWTGLLILLGAICTVWYISIRVVYWRMSLRWSAVLNILSVLVMLTRWLTVAGAVWFLIQTS